MRPLLAALVLVALAAGCAESGPPSTPPEGWVAASDTRWYAPGTDTTRAFRDLSTIEAMGVARDGEFVRWVQERMTDLYRSEPEVVDSVFAAEFMDDIEGGVSSSADQQASEALVNRIKTEFFQRYNGSRYQPPAEPLALPAELANVSGRVAAQVYVNKANEPVAIWLVEGTGTALDQLFMRRVLDGSYSDAWVRERAGRVEGTEIEGWVHVETDFTGE
ncbi:hypothetical protein [Rubrivirga sp. IMCC43871]|uniref:hypothetical protein n=1 Tax=Rubrivirga sp. IMCC43871 TaxID=3391575 RepID=UPI0039903816